ncbi:STM3941 family protein [Robertkochia solimangrovi]|uniref:STM3941 family protein n=1 Tax=Robertkochia solimangrovi TaxID=2213046 RepID=UPI00117CC511|nr:STM3941 family protein [Robertkochia solimangrovi]TRZ41657.1 hypothetical protein DMZ48_16750 [Robertkochia solimangrovi]
MEVIIHKKNKNRLILSIILIVLLIVLFYFLVIFFKNPSEHTFFLFPTKNSILLFSLFGMTVTLIAFLNFIYNIFFMPNPILRIDDTGIYNEFFYYNKKHIIWSEIKTIQAIKYNQHEHYIAIFLKELVNNERGIRRIIFSLNHKLIGTPYLINYRSLDCSFNQLKKEIFDAYKQNR